MQTMTLQEIVTAVDGTLQQNGDCVVEAVCTDTRKIEQQALFVPIKGDRFDGHDFITQALAEGAAAALSQQPIENQTKPVVYVEDTRRAFGALSGYYRNRFTMPLVGVTGSVGKTSTKEMIATVLEARGAVHKTQGNFNNDIGLPHTLFGLSAKHTAAVIEMGMSARGEISYLTKLAKPTIGVITNIGVSHLENLKTRENILKAKLELLDGMAEDAPLILNADNDLLAGAIPLLGGRVRSYGIDVSADVMAKEVRQVEEETHFVVYYKNESYPAVLPTIGIHNVYNALAAFLVGIEVGMSPIEIIAQFPLYQNAGLRQKVFSVDGMKIIADCYNASPDSMQSALQVIANIAVPGKRYAVLGDMLELGATTKQMHFEVGETAARMGVDTVFCYGNLAKEMQKGVQSADGQAVHHTDAAALADAIGAVVKSGDAIIFKASRGMRLEQVLKLAFPQIKEI